METRQENAGNPIYVAKLNDFPRRRVPVCPRKCKGAFLILYANKLRRRQVKLRQFSSAQGAINS